MGILDSLFGSSPSQPATPTPQPSAAPTSDDFIRNYVAAAAAGAQGQAAHTRGLFNLLTGRDVNAAQASATANAPAAWDAYKQAQAGSQNAQLGAASNIASQGAMANTNIDPNNIEASIPDIQKSLSGVYNAGGANSADPLVQRRAFYDRMIGMFSRMPNGAQYVKDFQALRDQGLKAGMAVAPDGTLRDPVNGQVLSGNLGTVEASQAQPTKAMETGFDIAKANHQAGLDIGVHSANANTDAAHELVDGLDPKTGLPTTQVKSSVLANPGSMVKSNPFFEGQQSELKELRTKSESADQGLDLAQQISNAANGIYTGKGANALQDVRKWAQLAGNLTGTKPDDKMLNSTSKFEQLKFASQQLVAVASHNLSPRVAMNIYNQISAVKPGDATSMKGLRDIINAQIVPALQRDKALFKGTSSYYQANPFKNDAATVVPGQAPLEQFGVRDVHSAQPGDFYIDPQSGNLRQRPGK